MPPRRAEDNANANDHDHDNNEPSPSPPPSAPIPLTPGLRASRLHQVFTESLSRTIRANSYENFSACFPTPAKHVPHSLESVWRQLNGKLEESAKAEFDGVCRERDVVRGLNELDRLVGEAKLRRENGEGEGGEGEGEGEGEGQVVAPHTLNAKELYQAHLTPYLEKAQETLDSKLEKTQSENAELAEKIQQQRQEIESLLASVEGVVGDLEGAVKATTEFDTEGNLRKEVLEMDEAVKASPQP